MSFGHHFAMVLNASGSPMVGSCRTFWKISKATNGASNPTADMAQVCDVTWAYVVIDVVSDVKLLAWVRYHGGYKGDFFILLPPLLNCDFVQYGSWM